MHAWEDGRDGIDVLGCVGEEGEHVVEDAFVHYAVEVDDVHVAGEKLEDGGHVDWGRRFGVVGAAGGKLAEEMLRRLVPGMVVMVQG